MKKITLVFGGVLMTLMIFAMPALAQGDTTNPEATTPATTQAPADANGATASDNQPTRTDAYRGIIPAAQNKDGSVKSNVNIDCGDDIGTMDLGAKIHCGRVTLNDFPALIIYLIQWILTLAGGIAVIMIMIGGFQYMLGGVTDDKERGKKTLVYAIGGLIVSFMAWWIVELVQVWITS